MIQAEMASRRKWPWRVISEIYQVTNRTPKLFLTLRLYHTMFIVPLLKNFGLLGHRSSSANYNAPMPNYLIPYIHASQFPLSYTC